jgi:hypothetical protein
LPFCPGALGTLSSGGGPKDGRLMCGS